LTFPEKAGYCRQLYKVSLVISFHWFPLLCFIYQDKILPFTVSFLTPEKNASFQGLESIEPFLLIPSFSVPVEYTPAVAWKASVLPTACLNHAPALPKYLSLKYTPGTIQLHQGLLYVLQSRASTCSQQTASPCTVEGLLGQDILDLLRLGF